jgi:hypothetical protein
VPPRVDSSYVQFKYDEFANELAAVGDRIFGESISDTVDF